jgi:hypothetical protein
MQTILQLDMAGFGVFSMQGAALIAGCWLVLMALHPWILAVSRMSDAVDALRSIGKKSHATSLHGLDSSSAGAAGAPYLIRGEALLAGLALFAIGLSTEIFGTPGHVLHAVSSSSPVVRDLSLLGMTGFLVTGIVDNFDISWRKALWSRLSGLGNLMTYALIPVVFLLSEYDPIATLSYIALGSAMRAFGTILARGLQIYQLGALIWVPALWASWVIVTLILSLLGPLFLVLRWFLDKPRLGSLPFGSKREKQIMTSEVALPRSFAIDAMKGMISPR